DPTAAPIVDPNYLAEPSDLAMSIEGLKLMREIMGQPVFARYISGEHLPGNAIRSDAECAEYIRRQGRTCYHPVGTCRMGSDDAAVVDLQLRVRGVDGLRVIDASVMPTLPTGNTNAPTIMIAERAADLIRSN